MKKLSTIQKRENLNSVFRMDDVGPGGAHHNYVVRSGNTPGEGNEDRAEMILLDLSFQKGARKDPEARHGIIDTDLLEIVRDRLKCFQGGEFATRENAFALAHLEEALMWMNRRVEDRIERAVLGTYEK